LVVDSEARAWLAVHGYDARMGARPMARVVKENIKKQLAEELLFGCLSEGGEVTVSVNDDQLTFDFHEEEAIVS